MERKKLKQILLDFGYKVDTINKMLQNKTRPTLPKAYELEERYGISIYVWKNLKAYLDDTPKESKTSRVQESYHDKESVKQGDTDEPETKTSKRHTDTRGDSREDRHKAGICDESAA